MDEYSLPIHEIALLKEYHSTLSKKREADRVKAVILLGIGRSVADVAEILMLDERTVRVYFSKYKGAGHEALIQMNYTGTSPLLTPEQQEELAQHLDENFYIDSKYIIQHIHKTYGIKYSPSGMKDLLHRIGFVYKKPKRVPCKVDPVAQEEFIAEYEKLRKNKGENDPVYFADGVHPQYNGIPAYGWIRRGEDKELKTSSGRQRVNINGAIDIDTLKITVDFTDSVNAQSTIRLLEKLEAKHPHAETIHVIIDNAKYYKSKLVAEYLKNSKIELHFLPPYSPNLNLIERLWKFFKKKILYNKYYEKFSDFFAACKNFFRCRTKYKAELRTLLTENFQRFGGNA